MSTRTRQKIVKPETEEYHLCDICGEEIVIDEDGYITHCEMCGRDIHDDGKRDCSGCDPEERETPLCKICLKLGEEYWALLNQQEADRDEAHALWAEKCQEHQYDV